MPSRTKQSPSPDDHRADAGQAITDTPPLDALTRRVQAERDKLAARVAAIDAELAAATAATAQEREAEADRARALADADTRWNANGQREPVPCCATPTPSQHDIAWRLRYEQRRRVRGGTTSGPPP